MSSCSHRRTHSIASKAGSDLQELGLQRAMKQIEFGYKVDALIKNADDAVLLYLFHAPTYSRIFCTVALGNRRPLCEHGEVKYLLCAPNFKFG